MPSFFYRKSTSLFRSFSAHFLLALALIPSASSLAQAQQRLIEEIVIHGNRKIPAETVRNRIYTRAGDVYDEPGLQRDFSSLWNTGYYEDIRFEREESPKGYRIHVYLKEKPTIRRIEYKGLNAVPQTDVLTRFKERKVGLSVESTYDPTKIKKAENALRELLSEHGRQFATITPEISPIPPASVAVTFNIKEGPKVKVGKISFEGNKKISDRVLRASMRGTKPIGIPKSIFLENLFSRTYDSTKLQQDLDRGVRDTYQQKGYFKAVVGEPTTKMRDTGKNFFIPWSKPGKAVDISIPVEEGDKFKLGSITFKGNKQIANTKALRAQFPIKDGETFNVAHIRKGLENLQKAYGQGGFINMTPVPNTVIDDANKTVSIEIDVDEGKSYTVRRIEFTGNTTTRDKVIRRELAVEEGGVYNSQYWELSLHRLNQLQYFEPLKPEDATDIKKNDAEATVDLTLKVKEKGKNSIGLTGGVSGLAGSFIGLNYETNNFLGLGETLRIEANIGSRERNLLFGFTEPYLMDKPIQFGFTVFTRKYDFNQARESEILLNQDLDFNQDVLDTFQNFSSKTTGFTVSTVYPLRRSFKRVGLTYSFDISTISAFSELSRRQFEYLAFRNISGQNALEGIVTSKILPSFSWSTIDNPQRPHRGNSFYAVAEISGLGGNVASIRPVVEWKHFIPFKNLRPNEEGSQTLAYRIQAGFITGYRGLVANPAERFYSGGENDIRGFDIRSMGPYVYLPDVTQVPLVNPDDPCLLNGNYPVGCVGVLKDPSNPLAGTINVPLPTQRIVFPGGDTNLIGNIEYRIPIVGPVTLAAFADVGMNMAIRTSQLRISDVQFNDLNTTKFGCPGLVQGVPTGTGCLPGSNFNFTSKSLQPIKGTNYVPRMSTGIELQVLLPIVNAPMRIYYAYNPLLLDTTISSGSQLTRQMFPAGGAGDISFLKAKQIYEPSYRLKEPRKTFRFTVATTF